MKIGLLITLAVALLMSTMFVGVLATQIADKTELTPATDTLNIGPARLMSWAGNATINNEDLSTVSSTTGADFAVIGYDSVICVIINITNATSGVLVTSTNYTQTNCHIRTNSGAAYENESLHASYLYNYKDVNGALDDTYEFTITNAIYSGWRADYSECEVNAITLKNQTGDIMTATTDYVFTPDTAILTLNNVDNLNGTASNSTTLLYDHCGDDYITGWGNSTFKLIPGIFVLMILCSCFVLVKVFEEMKKE